MRNNKLSILGLFIGAAFLQACPQASPQDAGATDAAILDASQSDSAQEQDAASDAGCAQSCDQAGDTPLSVEGECVDSLLRYCENNCVVEIDCAGLAGGPYICGLYAPFYECLAGAGQDCEPNYWDCDPATNCTGQQPCDESAGLFCEERGTSFLCVHSESMDAGPNPEDAAFFDAAATDSAMADRDAANPPDSANTDLQSTDLHSTDLLSEDLLREDAANPLEDAGLTTEDAGISEDSGQEDSN